MLLEEFLIVKEERKMRLMSRKGGFGKFLAGIGIGAGLKLAEISICHDAFGKPFVEITPQIQYYLGLKNCSQISVSISHDGEYAIAVCVIC